MTFKSLQEAHHAYEALAMDRDAILSMLKAYQYALCSLIATHPDHKQLQLHLASILETANPERFYGPMSELERESFENTIATLQAVRPMTQRIDPMAHLSKKS